MHEVTLITGDGIGPEIADAAKKCVDKVAKIRWDIQEAGTNAFKEEGDPLPQRVVDSIKKTGTALKAPITTPLGEGFRSVNVRLRQELDLYAAIRPSKTMKGVPNARAGVDTVVVRENTQGLYAGIEFPKGEENTKRIAEITGKGHDPENTGYSLKYSTEDACKRICEHAFGYAKDNSRSKVSCVTKSNIMKVTDGMFMHACNKASKDYPDIEYEHVLVDAACMQLVMKPERFDVIVAPNLYADILSDLCAGLTGGLGLAPGANIGKDHAVFEAVHGSAPDIAGKGVANPSALILSAAMMLEHLGEKKAAAKLRFAVEHVVAEGVCVTEDLKPGQGKSTYEMADAIASNI